MSRRLRGSVRRAGRRPLLARLGSAMRRAWEELIGGSGSAAYKGAEMSRLLADWITALITPDEEIRYNLPRLRARARDLVRNNAYAKQYLNLVAVNVIGPHGMKFQAQVRNNNGDLTELLNEKIEDAFCDWCRRPTLSGRGSLVSLQQLLVRAVAGDGETLVRIWRQDPTRDPKANRYGLALEAIDADMLDETFFRARGEGLNEVRMGVEVDERGRRVAYHVWNAPPSMMGITAKRERERIPASDIIHLYDPDRVNQTRGVTWFHPVMMPLKMLQGYIESESVAARVCAAKMGFFQRKGGEAGELNTDDKGNLEMEADPGSFGILPDGYELATFDPNHPTSAFPEFIKSLLREIATGLRVSYNALANDLEGVNYSSMRSGLLVEREVWRSLQQWWISEFLGVVYREWLNMALLTGTLTLDQRDPSRFEDVKWIPRGWAWVDPLKDSQASVVEIQLGLASRQSIMAEQGEDFEEVLEQLAEEEKLALAAGVDIKGPTVRPAGDTTVTDNTATDETSGKSGSKNGNRIAHLLETSRNGGAH